MSKILYSTVNKPEDKVVKSIQVLSTDIRLSIEALQEAVSEHKPDLSLISQNLTSIGDAIDRLEKIDNSIDPSVVSQPIIDQIAELKQQYADITRAINAIDVKPEVKVDAPDLTSIDESFKDLDKSINELFRDLDLMEKPELKEYLKKILDLLDKINKKNWTILGGGGGQSALSAYLINTQTLVNVSAVESADTPGVYGILALNADGSAIGSGGGVVETFKRVTSTGDIRVTSSGDTRVYV